MFLPPNYKAQQPRPLLKCEVTKTVMRPRSVCSDLLARAIDEDSLDDRLSHLLYSTVWPFAEPT
jgi:hypothetical protein